MMIQLKTNISLIQKNRIHYEADKNGRVKHKSPWLGNWAAFLYDMIMKKNVFPKKFGSNWDVHAHTFKNLLSDVKDRAILELGTGSGITAQWLSPANIYAGVDISAGLLKHAVKNFERNEFADKAFYIADVCSLPFSNHQFDVCLCILTLNFFEDLQAVIQEIKRTLKSGGIFYGCVPVPDRLNADSNIRGVLRSEKELQFIFSKNDFDFIPLPVNNGGLFYFSAVFQPDAMHSP